MFSAKELLIIKARLEAAAVVLGEDSNREIHSRALRCLQLPASLTAGEAETQLHAAELLLDIKNDPAASTPESELELINELMSDVVTLSHEYAAVADAVRQLSLAPGYKPALETLAECERKLPALEKLAAERWGSIGPVSEGLLSSLREYESLLEQSDADTEDLLIRIAEEILSFD